MQSIETRLELQKERVLEMKLDKLLESDEEVLSHNFKPLTQVKNKCKFCMKRFFKGRCIVGHMANKHNICSPCKNKFIDFKALAFHRKNYLCEGLKCSMCRNTFRSSHKLKKHIEKIHFQCNSCAKKFTNFMSLTAHKENVHYQCGKCHSCNMTFSRNYNMKNHIQTTKHKRNVAKVEATKSLIE